MANSSQRKLKTAKQRRLSVEQLETRTVLSATNPFAATLEITPDFEDRFELEHLPAFVASQFESQDEFTGGIFANRSENQPPLPVRLERFPADLTDWTVDRVEINDVQSTDEMFVSFVESIDARLQRGTLDRLAPFTIFSDAADFSARSADNVDHLELFERRASLESDDRFERPRIDIFNNSDQLFTDRFGDGGFVDIGVDRPDLNAANRDRIFDALGSRNREERWANAQDLRPEQLLSRQKIVGETLSSRSEQKTAVSLGTDVSSPQLPGGLAESSSQHPVLLWDSLAAQALFATGNEQLDSLSRQSRGTHESPAYQLNAWLDVSTPGLAASLPTNWLAETSLANKASQSDGGLIELDISLTAQPKAIRHNASPLPADAAWWHEALRHATGSFWLEFNDEVESRLATIAAQQLDREVGEHDAEIQHDDATRVDVEEGGMIELIAAAYPNPGQSSPQPATQTGTLRQMPEKVRMDTGVGMFQVFELATSPQSSPNETELKANELDPPIEITAANAPDTTPPAEQAAAISENSDTPPIRAASFGTLLAAASLFFTRSRRPEDKSLEARRGR